MKLKKGKMPEAAERAKPYGIETTLEDEVIYSPEIMAHIEDALDGLATDRSKRSVLETLVYRSIKAWTGV